jgi:tetraacyldisaccharide-1-P 4'-kinase
MKPIEVKLRTYSKTPKWWQNYITDLRTNRLPNNREIIKALATYDIDYIAWDDGLQHAKLIFNDPKKYTWFILRWS